jgi:hypothetical protein
MKVENLFHIILIFLVGLSSCSRKSAEQAPEQSIRISLSEDSSGVELHGLDADVLEWLGTDTLGEKEWQGFFAIFSDQGDPELRDLQRPLAGEYRVKDRMILFVPAEKFKPDSVYFARYYSRDILEKPSDLIMREGSLSGNAGVVEFVFKR